MLEPNADVFCVGGACMDRTFRTGEPVRRATSNPARAHVGFGGVARNVAESLARLRRHVQLIAAVGDDADGAALIEHARRAGIDVGRIAVVPQRATGNYIAILEPDGELAVGACDAGPVDTIDAVAIDALPLDHTRWVFADGNLTSEALGALIRRRTEHASFRLAIDGVSVAKIRRMPNDLSNVDLLFLNVHQAEQRDSLPNAANVILTRGAQGVDLLIHGVATHLDAVPATPVDVTGAGDALAAATLHALLAGEPIHEAVRTGMLAATLTLESSTTVRPDLTPELLEARRRRQ